MTTRLETFTKHIYTTFSQQSQKRLNDVNGTFNKIIVKKRSRNVLSRTHLISLTVGFVRIMF